MPAQASTFAVATRFDKVGFSDIVLIRNRVLELLAAGEDVFQFEGGEPYADTADFIKDAMLEALRENKTRYAPSSGIPQLRSVIATKLAEHNGIGATTDQILIVNGGMQALFGAFQAVLNPGDEVMLFSPYWTPIADMVANCEGSSVLVPTARAREEGIRETLSSLLTPRTKAIYFNTPQNPTGLVFSRAEAEAVAAFALEHDLVVISDEAYEDLVYDGEHVSIATLDGMFERTISCFTLSKSYAMTGWRVGYVVSAEPWMTGMKKSLLYTTNGVSTPTQWAAIAAMNTPRKQLDVAREEYRTRRDTLVSGLNELGFPCAIPAGAFYAFPNTGRLDPDSRKAAAKLLNSARVSTVPGIVFGPHGEGHVRMSLATSMESIQGALTSMQKNL